MQFIEDLEFLTKCGDSWAEEKAKLAQGLYKDFQKGNLTEDEYAELMEDLVRTDEIDAAETSIEIKSMLVGAIMMGAKLV